LPFGVATIDDGTAVSPAPPMPSANPAGPRASEDRTKGAAADRASGAVAPAMPGSGSMAPQGESDSDPFAVTGSIEFKPGKTNAQLGRPHKLTRPRIDLGGIVQSLPLGRIQVDLLIHIDVNGNVTAVKVLHPSGSDNIDQACRVEAYNWWFQPRKDRNGKPLPTETLVLSIGFQ
jgi:hypothetical protein